MTEQELEAIERNLHWHKPAAQERITQLIAEVRRLRALTCDQERVSIEAEATAEAGIRRLQAQVAALEQERNEARYRLDEARSQLALATMEEESPL